ncbi:hypothetical protein QUW44_00185 [Limosilactobacillus pontis]|uniref:Uncharacterized protein n=2 Tax=Limosilactobacillus pontis TaxID=35787 RepID=A0ABT7UX54_9LACO|nr:hypothetical protein [Limosilactobacillus pontis]
MATQPAMTNAFRVKNICETKKVLELTGFKDVKHKYLYPFILTQMKGFGRMNFDDILAKLDQTTNLLQALDDELSLTLDHVGTKSLTTSEARAIAYEIRRDKGTIETLLAVARDSVIDSTKQLSAYNEAKGGEDE